MYKIHEMKCVVSYTDSLFWYAAFLQMVLQEQQYQAKNKNLRYEL